MAQTEAALLSTFIRRISLAGRVEMETIFMGNFTLAKDGVGRITVSDVGGNSGNSFTFHIDAELGIAGVIVLADKALRLWDSMDLEARQRFLTARPVKSTRGVFC